MTNARESTMRRIAIVLASLPQPVAQRLLGSLNGDTQQLVRDALSSLSDVDPLERRRAIDGFTRSLRSNSNNGGPNGKTNSSDAAEIIFSRTAIRNLNERDADGSPIDQGLHAGRSENTDGKKPVPFAFLCDVDDESLVAHLSGERPQTLAIILASISPSQAARVLPRLEVNVRVEAMRRMATLSELPNELLDDIGNQLRTRLSPAPRSHSTIVNGAGQRALDAILAELPSELTTSRVSIPETMRAVDSGTTVKPDFATSANAIRAEQRNSTTSTIRIAEGTQREQSDSGDPQLARKNDVRGTKPPLSHLRSTDSIHQFLVSLPATQLRDALGKAPIRQALLALCGLPNATAEAVFASLPRKQAKQVRDQLASLGSLELREIDEAKEFVATMALSEQAQRVSLTAA